MSVMTIDTRPARDIHIGCHRHPFEPATAACERCHTVHCSDCVVFPFRTRNKALCIPCALIAGG
ncbi:MAG: hypothetical protein JO054_09210, partial [Actinobacteria bacterium]|nr:hypothetical protein [Actinomycetota bacterium]